VEFTEECEQIDIKNPDILKDYPNYLEIESADAFLDLDKASRAFKMIQRFMPNCCKKHFENSKH
tara:strand:- start:3185 stop:3376 length:192 start_codon:yes stop_codon:yes gene_type:complete